MNKRSIVFILILSLLISFFPPFAFDVKANNSISVSINTGDYDSWSDGIRDKTQGILGENGYVVNPSFYDDTSSDGFDVWNWLLTPYIDNGFTEDTSSGKPLPQQLYDYSVENDIDVTSIINDNDTSLVSYADSNCPYVIYQAMPVSYFLNDLKYAPGLNGQVSWTNFKSSFSSLVNGSDSMYLLYFDSWVPVSNYNIISVSSDVLDNYSFCLNYGTLSNWQNYSYQTYSGFDATLPSDLKFSGTLALYNNSGLYSGNVGFSRNSFSLTLTSASNVYGYFALGLFNNAQSSGSYTRFEGTPYIVPDSWGAYSFLVFKSYNLLNTFYSGNSSVYQFNPSVDFGDKAGDINFGDLYSFLSTHLDFSLGDISAQINGLANDYLEEQLVILHDINNALNDGNGNSWLRKIFKLMETTFPVFKAQNDLLAQKLDFVIDAIENIHIDGGSGSGSSSSNNIDYSPELLTLHNDLLDLKTVTNLIYANMLLDSESDEDPELDDVLSVMSSRFPFCMVGDVVLVIEIFNAEPVKPDLYFTVPFQPSETWSLDLSFYDGIRPYVFALLTLGFLIFLIRLSMKVYESLKG